MNSQKSLAPVVLISIVIVLLAGGIFAWQYFSAPKEEAKDETADWKTYKNEVYGFGLKYPSEFKFFSEGPNSEQQAIDKGEHISGTAQPS